MRAKKSFGQHFLKDPAFAERIANSLELPEGCDRVLEVGPGKGILGICVDIHLHYTVVKGFSNVLQ